ncbi:MAG: hypothetical protein E7B11_08805 [Clostridiales bacterium]|nr:hypothetical protein [Clostridiales bacterium]MDU3240657.1 hypothetical protein [Clostridiales bacterium]
MKNKRIWIVFISVILLCFIIVAAIVLPRYYKNNVAGTSSGTVVKEYGKDTYQKVFGSNNAYALGLNAEDMPVFKNKELAFDQICTDCPNGIQKIKEKNNLKKLTNFSWKEYATYASQTSDEEYQDEIDKVAIFFDIYSSSFK